MQIRHHSRLSLPGLQGCQLMMNAFASHSGYQRDPFDEMSSD